MQNEFKKHISFFLPQRLSSGLLKKKFLLAGFSLMAFSVSNFSCLAETVFLKGTAYQTGIALKNINVGASEVIVSNAAIKRVAVADPSVASVRVLSDTSALVMGRKLGKTTLLIWEGKEASVRPTRFDITVRRDITDLIASLKSLDPNINVDYILIPSNKMEAVTQPPNSNGAYTTSFRTKIDTVGDPAPSVVVDNSQGSQPASTGAGGAGAGGDIKEKVILSGKIKSADIIAKALTIASTYMGFDATMKIVTRNGGVLAEQMSSLLGDGSGGGGGGAGGGTQSLENPMAFTSNLKGNLANGSIITNGDGSIVSMLEVGERPQVSVMIRFYEISRGTGKELSGKVDWLPVNRNNSNIGGGNIGTNGLLGNVASTAVGLVSNAGAGTAFSIFPKQNLAIQIKALEQRGEVKLLAEPTLVVASGEPGRFLAGGEIPIQQGISTLGAIGQQVRFETFGISLNVLPTITDDDSLLMNVMAQTRDLDSSNPFIPAGSNLPAFKTRKAETQVELDPSQVLVIGGLINANSVNNLSKIPLFGDIPILGLLARSKKFTKEESELVIVLSPEIIRGAHPSQVIKPMALENSRPGEFDFIPTRINTSRTGTPIGNPPPNMPARGPVDLSRPTTVNDLDHIYK